MVDLSGSIIEQIGSEGLMPFPNTTIDPATFHFADSAVMGAAGAEPDSLLIGDPRVSM